MTSGQKMKQVNSYNPGARTGNQPEPLITSIAFDALSISKDLPLNMADITEKEMETAIKAMKNNKAAGLDEIPAKLLKDGWRTQHNSSTDKTHGHLKYKCFPDDWRKGVIVKLPEKGDITTATTGME